MLFCIVGPSGVGKTALVNKLAERGLKSVESFTTRAPRYKDEKGHVFISEEKFYEIKKTKGMVSKTYFDGNFYGVTKDMLLEADLFVVDVDGIKALAECDIPFYTIGLYAPEDVLKKRMENRGDNPLKIESRIRNDENMFKDYRNYCNIVVNSEIPVNDLAETVYSIICSKQLSDEKTDHNAFDDVYVYVRNDLIIRIYAGTGENLSRKDLDAGYVDYINYDVYEFDNGIYAVVGEMMMFKAPLREQFDSLSDTVDLVLKEYIGTSNVKHVIFKIGD